MSRRQLLKALGVGAVTVASLPLLQACAPAAPATQKPTDAGKPAEPSKPAETAKPADAAKPAEAAKPAAPASGQVAAGSPKRGGTLEVVVQNDWTTMDAIYSTSGSGVAGMICDDWIRWDQDDKGQWGPVPAMIAEWDLKPNAVTLKLQKGIKFHDGTPWDAKAAKWNLDRAAFDPSSGLRSFLGSIDRSKEDSPELDKMKAAPAERFEFSSKAI